MSPAESVGSAGMDRRRFLTSTATVGAAGAVAGLLGAGTAAATGTPAVPRDLRVVVMVVDGCRRDEAAGPLMPTFERLGDEGVRFTNATSIPVAETIPNHVAMMSGVLPRRSGVPANRMRAIATAQPGVESVRTPAELAAGPEVGDLVAFCRAGYRFSDPTPTSNPIPGNHDHAVTLPIPLVVSGGVPSLPRGRSVATAVRTVDVAPGVAALFGLRPPPGGWDGGRTGLTG